MGQIEITPHLLTVFGFVICAEELWVNLIKRWRGMLQFAQDWSAINISEQSFVVFCFVWEPSIINKNILGPLTLLGFTCNANWHGGRVVQSLTHNTRRQGGDSTGGISRWP